MIPSLRRNALALVLASSLPALVAAPSIARAQITPGKEHAKRLFDEGLELEKKNDFAGALAKYKEASAIAITAGLRFHIGYCLEMTGKLVAALEEYEAAEKLARDQNKQDVRTAVAARLEPLKSRVPQIAIRLGTPVNGAEVQVDGVTVGSALLDGKSFRIDPGDHVVTARAPGHAPWRRDVRIAEAATTRVDVPLEPEAAPVIAPAAAPADTPAGHVTEPPREPPRSRSLALPVATTAGAVVLLAGGFVSFGVAGGAQSDALRQCPSKLSCDDERSKVRTFDTLALAGFIGAAGLGVLSVILWTHGGSRSSAGGSTRLVASPQRMGVEETW